MGQSTCTQYYHIYESFVRISQHLEIGHIMSSEAATTLADTIQLFSFASYSDLLDTFDIFHNIGACLQA
jgi:hypothetical protein